MNMTKRVIIFIIICILATVFIVARFNRVKTKPVLSLIAWTQANDNTNYQDLAKKNNQKIFLFFHTTWCGWCDLMLKTTFLDKKVANYFKNKKALCVLVDGDKCKKLVAKYKIRGYPTSIFINPNQEIKVVTGFQKSKDFLPELTQYFKV